MFPSENGAHLTFKFKLHLGVLVFECFLFAVYSEKECSLSLPSSNKRSWQVLRKTSAKWLFYDEMCV